MIWKILAAIYLAVPIYMISKINMTDTYYPQECVGPCYEAYLAEHGTPAETVKKQIALAGVMSPGDKGKKLYPTCAACHGMGGEGGIGPVLAGQTSDDIVAKLSAYKAGETIGAQSALMWGQAAALSEDDIANLAVYISTGFK